MKNQVLALPRSFSWETLLAVCHTREVLLKNLERAGVTTDPLFTKGLQNSEIISYQQVSRPDFSSVDRGVTKVNHVPEATVALLVLLRLEEMEVGY